MNAATEREARVGLMLSLRSSLKAGTRVQPTATATFARVRNGGVVISDGPFAETKELTLGIVVMAPVDLDASSLEVVGQIPSPAWAPSR